MPSNTPSTLHFGEHCKGAQNAPLTESEVLALDSAHVWHPYSKIHSDYPLTPIQSASGVHLTQYNGKTLIDGMSSWWCTIHGYSHPRLVAAAQHQVAKMSHVMFGGLTHEPAVSLCHSLVELSPEGLNRVFLCDSGSVSVEVAMKMALQYWQGKSKTRHRFLSLKRGYHGDTFAAMSVCDPETGMHSLFSDALNTQVFADSPTCGFDEACSDKDFENFAFTLRTHEQTLAAVILEPILQGAGGMRFYSAEFLQRVRALCDETGILLIADEIATGFGRTGRLFACEHAAISPDILCLGKSLTGGMMTLAATLCTESVAEGICASEAGVFMHGPTFMGNPLACAVANESVSLLMENKWQAQVANIEQSLRKGLAPCTNMEGVADVRCLGAIGVVELKEAVDMASLQPMFVEEGVWIRPFGKLVYTMPAFIIDDDTLAILCKKIVKVVDRYLSESLKVKS